MTGQVDQNEKANSNEDFLKIIKNLTAPGEIEGSAATGCGLRMEDALLVRRRLNWSDWAGDDRSVGTGGHLLKLNF